MITNLPSDVGLNTIALRLYFSAWTSLVKIYDDFAISHEPAAIWNHSWPGTDLTIEWEDYIKSCQPDLQAICTVIQQSQELALKSRIATVSPYLLLLRSDIKFTNAVRDVDFSSLRTLDAVDLPGAVNHLSKDTLSDSFIQTYERIRAMRNQIAHLGAPNLTLTPIDFIMLLLQQFIEIWSTKSWLQERKDYAATSRLGFFHDGSNSSAEMEVMHEMPFIIGMMPPASFKKLFKHKKSARRYYCPSCLYAARTDYADSPTDAWKTAFLSDDGKHVTCAMCRGSFEVVAKKCSEVGCRGNLQCTTPVEYDGLCVTCGEFS